MPSIIEPPFYPIIYVRGYAGSDSEVEDTVSDPYMGFNLGATRIRTVWTGETERLYFESPIVRLMKDFRYQDVYSAGADLADVDQVPDDKLDPRSIIIYRYYDLVSSVFGTGKQVAMEDFGNGLAALILKVRDRVCKTDEDKKAFKVYLVGHSMGGLVIRCFLQNDKIADAETRALVDKVFTYATPHNGIELDIIGNVPAFFNYHSVTNFNRDRMRDYLGLPAPTAPADPKTEPVNSLNGKFDPDRFFCLVGTDPKDFTVAAGWSARVVGPFSDGLVRINNAVLFGPTNNPQNPTRLAPRAYVHRSHSGYYGIVNSEEGFQNLTRFLFGDVRVDGELEIRDVTLPTDLEAMRKDKKEVRASYHFESISRVRGAHWDLSRRVANENSTVFRKYGELFPERAQENVDRDFHDRPQLFTVFLSTRAKVDKRRPSLGFSLDLGVLVPDYEVDGVLWTKNHYPGGYIFREKINLEATPPEKTADGLWQLRYGFDSDTPNRATKTADRVGVEGGVQFSIPIVQKKRPGIDATLILTAKNWS
jgi:PGAP1-like protein